MPGDPGRVELAGALLGEFRMIGRRREFVLGVGTHAGREIVICSTGIGGPSTEIAVVELARLGVRTMIRVGGMGSLDPDIPAGQMTQVTTVLRSGGGAAGLYDTGTDPLAADGTVMAAIDAAGDIRGIHPVPVRVLSCDSYYLGQGRELVGLEDRASRRAAQLTASGAQALDMECETLFAVGGALGVRVGALLVAHGNRVTDDWLEDYEPAQERMLEIAFDAAAQLTLASIHR